MERFGAPTVGHERGCQPIEQFRMRRWFRTHSKIAWRVDKSGAKVMQPDAIHPDASSQRIIGRRDRAGHLEASAAVLERLSIIARDYLEKTARDFLPFRGRVAA